MKFVVSRWHVYGSLVIIVAMAASVVTLFMLERDQRRLEIEGETRRHAQTLGQFISRAVSAEEYEMAEQFAEDWMRMNEEIIAVLVEVPGGFRIVEIARPGVYEDTFRHEEVISYGYDGEIQLSVTRNMGDLGGYLRNYLVKSSLLILLLGFLAYQGMWLLLRTQEKKLLQEMADTDGLTGIANRRCFDRVLIEEWRRTLRSERSIALLMIDVDHFKNYNDRYGHLMGDRVLKSVAATLSRIKHRAGDMVARYGGEEFVLILPETDLAGAEEVAALCRQGVLQLQIEHDGNGGFGQVTISVGAVVIKPQPGMDAEMLINAADKALYAAKMAGRNRVVLQEIE